VPGVLVVVASVSGVTWGGDLAAGLGTTTRLEMLPCLALVGLLGMLGIPWLDRAGCAGGLLVPGMVGMRIVHQLLLQRRRRAKFTGCRLLPVPVRLKQIRAPGASD
jgi:hypothetical protein